MAGYCGFLPQARPGMLDPDSCAYDPSKGPLFCESSVNPQGCVDPKRQTWKGVRLGEVVAKICLAQVQRYMGKGSCNGFHQDEDFGDPYSHKVLINKALVLLRIIKQCE